MATKAEIRQRVGEDLALVPIGQDLENQDQARIDAAIEEIYGRLKEKGLATWASTAEVPTKLVPYFCTLVEQKLLTSYSVPDGRYQRIMTDAGQNGETAIANLAELATPEYETIDSDADF